MNNTATRMIRSEEITIDMRICTILAGGKKPGEVYFAAIAPDMELTVITLDEAPDILPCFDESDASIHLPDTSLLLCFARHRKPSLKLPIRSDTKIRVSLQRLFGMSLRLHRLNTGNRIVATDCPRRNAYTYCHRLK